LNKGALGISAYFPQPYMFDSSYTNLAFAGAGFGWTDLIKWYGQTDVADLMERYEILAKTSPEQLGVSSARLALEKTKLDAHLTVAFQNSDQGTRMLLWKSFGGIGVVVTPDNGSIRVTEVLSGSPAEKVGLKKDDLITNVEGESVSALTPEQVIEKLRGPAHSKVDLTIVRKGQDNALEVAVDREIIERHLTQGTPAK
jgi:predicted metalloprotease with PDZ domain